MSERAAPFHCPYCGDEDLRPHEAEDGPGTAWECRACLRAFSVKILGLIARPEVQPMSAADHRRRAAVQGHRHRGPHARTSSRSWCATPARELELAPAEEIVEWAVATFGERFCVTSSMADAVLAHLASRVAPGRRRGLPRHRLPLRGDDRHPRRGRGDAAGEPDHASPRCRRSAEQDATYGTDLLRPRPRPVLRAAQGASRSRTRWPAYDAWATGLRRDETHNRVDHPGRRLGRQEAQGQGLPDRAVDAATTWTATSPRTTCWSTRCSTTATRRSAAGRAPAASPPARTRAPAAGPAPARPSAGSTYDPTPRTDPRRQRGRRQHPQTPAPEGRPCLMTAPALVALAHGSRDPRSAETIKALVDEVRAMRPDLRIEPAFLELAKPSFGTVVDKLVKAGYDEIVVVPLLLTEAYHAKVDVPEVIAEATARHEGLQDPGHPGARPGDGVPRGPRPAAARRAQGRPGPRARRAGAGRRRLLGQPRQPGRRPARPAVGLAAQAAHGGGVRLRRSPGHRRGGARSSAPRVAGTSRSARCSWRPASCRTGPPSSPSRPARWPSRHRSAPTRRWPARSWPATPWAPSSSSPSDLRPVECRVLQP